MDRAVTNTAGGGGGEHTVPLLPPAPSLPRAKPKEPNNARTRYDFTTAPRAAPFLLLPPITPLIPRGEDGDSGAATAEEEQGLAASLMARYSNWVVEDLDELGGSFVLTDPAMPGHPIVYASRGLASLTGYPRRDVLGRNARLFQGAATDRAAVARVREAVRGQRAPQVAILNYRRDGSPHWVLVHVAPVFHAADGRVLHFLAVQVHQKP